MIRILGVNIPEDKKVFISLTYIFGIGLHRSKKILEIANISPDKKVKELSADEIGRIQGIIEKNYKTEGDLRREISGNIRRLKDIGSYRGTRHSKRLPVRGQRTSTNSRTVRGGGRKIAIKGKKKTSLK
jgi:small subunit ribosomal protein S13